MDGGGLCPAAGDDIVKMTFEMGSNLVKRLKLSAALGLLCLVICLPELRPACVG